MNFSVRNSVHNSEHEVFALTLRHNIALFIRPIIYRLRIRFCSAMERDSLTFIRAHQLILKNWMRNADEYSPEIFLLLDFNSLERISLVELKVKSKTKVNISLVRLKYSKTCISFTYNVQWGWHVCWPMAVHHSMQCIDKRPCGGDSHVIWWRWDLRHWELYNGWIWKKNRNNSLMFLVHSFLPSLPSSHPLHISLISFYAIVCKTINNSSNFKFLIIFGCMIEPDSSINNFI